MYEYPFPAFINPFINLKAKNDLYAEIHMKLERYDLCSGMMVKKELRI
jgi:hypothetical protein